MARPHSHDEIAKLAYEFWERRGRPYGSPEMDWHAAENALRAQDSEEEFSPFLSVQFGPGGDSYNQR